MSSALMFTDQALPHPRAPRPRRWRHLALVSSLWTAQVLLALMYIGSGMFKLSVGIPELAAAMKWPGDLPPYFVRAIGAIDLAGGLGILLPSLTRILPHLGVWAAAGCSGLQLAAIAFHAWRGEWFLLPFNATMLALSLFVWWGRIRAVPVEPRWSE